MLFEKKGFANNYLIGDAKLHMLMWAKKKSGDGMKKKKKRITVWWLLKTSSAAAALLLSSSSSSSSSKSESDSARWGGDGEWPESTWLGLTLDWGSKSPDWPRSLDVMEQPESMLTEHPDPEPCAENKCE